MKITIFQEVARKEPLAGKMEDQVNAHLKTIKDRIDVEIQLSSAFNDKSIFVLTIMVIEREWKIKTG
jgi:hypothetical protein